MTDSTTSRRSVATPKAPAAVGRGSPLDDLDRRIVRALQRDGRMSNTEVGRALGVPEATARKRIARLVDNGLIHVTAVPTPEAVGVTVSAMIGVSVTLTELDTVAERVRGFPSVRYLGISVGRYDLMIEAFFESQSALLDFVKDELGALPGVTDVETMVILKIAKFSYEWEVE